MTKEEKIDFAGILKQSSVEKWNELARRWRQEGIKIDLSGADLRNINLTNDRFPAGCGIDLRGARLNGANLDFARLGAASFTNADFTNAKLGVVDLRYADLGGANLSGADLSHSNLYGAILSGAKLNHAKLAGAKLNGANLSGANLEFASLTGELFYPNGADLSSAAYDEHTKFGHNDYEARWEYPAKLPPPSLPPNSSLEAFRAQQEGGHAARLKRRAEDEKGRGRG